MFLCYIYSDLYKPNWPKEFLVFSVLNVSLLQRERRNACRLKSKVRFQSCSSDERIKILARIAWLQYYARKAKLLKEIKKLFSVVYHLRLACLISTLKYSKLISLFVSVIPYIDSKYRKVIQSCSQILATWC